MPRDPASRSADSPTTVAWQVYYEEAARRRGARGDLDHRRLRSARKRRKQMERAGVIVSVAVVLLIAAICYVVLTR